MIVCNYLKYKLICQIIQKIYPGHYSFQNNTISVEYYNYKLNNITKEIIVQKETINNLLYGRENNFSEKEQEIINNWVNNSNIDDLKEKEYGMNDICNNIIEYLTIKNGKTFTEYNGPTSNLLYNLAEFKDYNGKDFAILKGKTICIDFVETEENKELYIKKQKKVKISKTLMYLLKN